MLPLTIAEAARRFADRTAYVSPAGWALSYADVDRISDEVAVGLAKRGVRTLEAYNELVTQLPIPGLAEEIEEDRDHRGHSPEVSGPHLALEPLAELAHVNA